MVYTLMTIKAMKYAYEAHLGQVDYNNVPYIFHPYHLAEQMEEEKSCTVALLHDVIEDTDTTLDDLKLEFLKNLKNNPIARKVKLADLEHNSDENRAVGCGLSEKEQIYWKEKYAKAKMILLD